MLNWYSDYDDESMELEEYVETLLVKSQYEEGSSEITIDIHRTYMGMLNEYRSKVSNYGKLQSFDHYNEKELDESPISTVHFKFGIRKSLPVISSLGLGVNNITPKDIETWLKCLDNINFIIDIINEKRKTNPLCANIQHVVIHVGKRIPDEFIERFKNVYTSFEFVR